MLASLLVNVGLDSRMLHLLDCDAQSLSSLLLVRGTRLLIALPLLLLGQRIPLLLSEWLSGRSRV